MEKPQVTILRRNWTKKSFGVSAEADFTVYLGTFRCRGYSSHGDMVEGYWGTVARASEQAELYAKGLAAAAGAVIVRGVLK